MNLISRTHHSYERRKYVFIVFREYTIISPHHSCERRNYTFMVFREYTIIFPNLKYCGKFDVGHEIHSDTLVAKMKGKKSLLPIITIY